MKNTKFMKRELPLIVYLDSSDYSTLSRKTLSPEYEECLNFLRMYSKSKKVTFVFSQLVVSEMLPIKIEDVESSISRLRLMNEICSRSVMNPALLIKNELTCAKNKKSKMNIILPKYDWLKTASGTKKPLIKPNFSVIDRSGFKKKVRQCSMKYNFKDSFSTLIIGRSERIVPDDILHKAFMYELRDINLFINIIKHSFELATALSEDIRSASSGLANAIRVVSDLVKGRTVDASEWEKLFEDVVVKIGNQFVSQYSASLKSALDFPEIEKYCPGLACSILSGLSPLKDAFAMKQPRSPNTSDLVDSLHALYCPYVDLFRADKYMSTQIVRNFEASEKNIVNKLLSLPKRIKECIGEE